VFENRNKRKTGFVGKSLDRHPPIEATRNKETLAISAAMQYNDH
jgi:hypothetical protein